MAKKRLNPQKQNRNLGKNKMTRSKKKYQLQDDDFVPFEEQDEDIYQEEASQLGKQLNFQQDHCVLKHLADQEQNDQRQTNPTEQEIELLYQDFKSRFKGKNINQLISNIYMTVAKTSGRDIKMENLEGLIHPELTQTISHCDDNMELVKHDDTFDKISPEKSTKRLKTYMKQNIPQQWPSKEIEVKWKQKLLTASAFDNHGYGVKGLSKEIEDTNSKIFIQRNRYKSLVNCIVNETYRKLQQFLIQECHKKIKPLNREETRKISVTLLHCRKNFEHNQSNTFLKFLRFHFGLSSVTISEQEAIKIYISIQKALKTAIGQLYLDRQRDTVKCNKQFRAKRSFQNERFQLHKIWTDELQTELLELYKRSQKLMSLRDHFKCKYPQHQHYFTVQSLRSRFHKIIRVALRKTSCFCQKFGQERIPNLIKLTDLKIKGLLRSPDAITARLFLIEIYLNDECDIRRLYLTVTAINEFVILKDNQKMSQIYEAEPLITSATEKISHNVTITKSNIINPPVIKDEVIFKGKERNFDHIVQYEDGKRTHYYRKDQKSNYVANQLNSQVITPIKYEEETKSPDKDSIYEQQEQLDDPVRKQAIIDQKSKTNNALSQKPLQQIIQQQTKDYLKSRAMYGPLEGALWK